MDSPNEETRAMSVTTISPRELHNELAAGKPVELIDVRTPAEFGEVHVSFARNLPLSDLEPSQFTGRHTSEPLYVICRSGSRANQACQKLIGAGVENVVNVEGGTQAWEQAGLPVKRGKKAISLERQVRIAAGTIVAVFSILAATVHPYFALGAAFVGAGLVFAGVTDTCGMALMLARMPWNQAPKSCATETSTPRTEAPTCCS
jgi:rhodanese-related sulfurtransferase